MFRSWRWYADHLAPDGTYTHLASGEAPDADKARRNAETVYLALTRPTKREAKNGSIRRVLL